MLRDHLLCLIENSTIQLFSAEIIIIIANIYRSIFVNLNVTQCFGKMSKRRVKFELIYWLLEREKLSINNKKLIYSASLKLIVMHVTSVNLIE